MAVVTLLFSRSSFYSCSGLEMELGSQEGGELPSYWGCAFYLLAGKHSDEHWCGY